MLSRCHMARANHVHCSRYCGCIVHITPGMQKDSLIDNLRLLSRFQSHLVDVLQCRAGSSCHHKPWSLATAHASWHRPCNASTSQRDHGVGELLSGEKRSSIGEMKLLIYMSCAGVEEEVERQFNRGTLQGFAPNVFIHFRLAIELS